MSNKNNDLKEIKFTGNMYWLYLDPFTFVFEGEDTDFIIYNSLTFKMIKINQCNSEVTKLITKLIDPNNMYVTSITKQLLRDHDILCLINKLREGFFGDIIPIELYETRPVIIPPILNVKNSIANIKKDPELLRKENLIGFFHELTLYVNGDCYLNCKFCDKYLKQFNFCTKSTNYFTTSEIDVLFDSLKTTNFSKINICGGNLFLYKHFIYLLAKLEGISVSKNFYIHYKNIDFKLLENLLYLEKVTVHLLVTHPIDTSMIQSISERVVQTENSINWEFVVSNSDELIAIQDVIEYYSIKYYSIKPFYNNNLDFFSKHIFTTEKDLSSSKSTSRDIFIKKSINIFDYGKLIITSEKYIYSNLNYPVIGNFNNNLIRIIEHELEIESPWFRTRDKLHPCKECAYCFLCPSPSNYEIAIGKSNLCSIYNPEKQIALK